MRFLVSLLDEHRTLSLSPKGC